MNIQRVLDSIYIIPVILDHLDHPTKNTEAILLANDINPVDDMKELSKLKDLLWYHKHVIQTGYQPDYALLRSGLKEYFDTYLTDVFKRLNLVGMYGRMLDYGCGNGYYGHQYLKDNPESLVYLMDREIPDSVVKNHANIIPIEDDFEAHPSWFMDKNLKNLDVILMSELLHCKTNAICKYLISSCCTLLKTGGNLIVIENQDPCMEYRISKIKGEPYPVIDMMTMDRFTMWFPLKIRNIISINQHFIYLYEKV